MLTVQLCHEELFWLAFFTLQSRHPALVIRLTFLSANFQVVFLNTRRRMIGVQVLSQGTLDTLLTHPREVFSAAIAKRAAAIILVPSVALSARTVPTAVRRGHPRLPV